jgi:hypothetical protein
MPLGFYVRVHDHKWLLFAESTVHTVASLTAQATRDAHSQGFLAPNQSLASLQLCLNGNDFVVLNPASEVSLLVAHCTAEKEAGHDVVLVGQAREQARWGGWEHPAAGVSAGCPLFPRAPTTWLVLLPPERQRRRAHPRDAVLSTAVCVARAGSGAHALCPGCFPTTPR